MLEHLPELEYVGSYYSMTLQNSHRKFYEQSYSSISTKVAALHKANDTTSFPSNIVSALKPYNSPRRMNAAPNASTISSLGLWATFRSRQRNWPLCRLA